jgi:succinate dehydrogenase/fumarate reductase flavoprotein subunit
VWVDIGAPVPALVVTGGEDGAEWTDAEFGDDVDEGIWHLWLVGRSTRTTEVIVTGSGVGVRMMAGACIEDLEFSLRIVERLIAWAGVAVVESEPFGMLDSSAVGDVYGPERVRSETDGFGGLVEQHIVERGSVTMPGPFRDVIAGVNVFRKLTAASSDIAQSAVMFEIMRQVHLRTSAGW